MAKNPPKIVHALDQGPALVDEVDVDLAEITQGAGNELAFIVLIRGRGNKQRRKVTERIVLPRHVLLELVAKTAHHGARADREMAAELTGAIEIGLDRRLAEIKAQGQ
jgi:hypothetical protein